MRSPLALMCCSALLASGVLPLGTLHSQGASASRKDSSADPLSLDLATIRTQYRALRRLRLTLEWYSRTQGETPVTELLYLGRERLFSPAALAVVDSARRRPGLSSDGALGLRFLRRRLAGEHVSLQAARFDDAAGAASTDAVVRVSFDSQPIPYLDLPLRQAAESNAARRAQLATAAARVMLETLNPILRQKHAAAQAAARAVGYRDYVAMSEDLRDVALDSLLASGVAYLTETDAIYKRTLDRVAREEVGVGLDGMRVVNFGRIFLSPTVARLFRKELQLPAVNMFLAGIGLDLRTARGGEVRVDDSLHPKKVPRAFVASVDPPADVRLSVKPQDGMGYLGTLLHETGHAVHFARSTVEPFETRVLGAGAASEAFGEFFRTALEDPPFLERYRAFLVARGEKAPTNAELASVMRRITLQQLYYTRRYAFAKLLYELRLHGRPASEVRHALARLPAPAKVMGDDEASLRELYGQAHSAAFGFTLNADETASFRSDVDDTFYSADYARAFVLSRMMHDAMRRKFGADWYGNPEVGRFLTRELFSRGNSLSAEDVAERLGMARRLDFSLAARRARAALASADSLERAR